MRRGLYRWTALRHGAARVIGCAAMIIHVGYHKTGSTFLQSLVFPRLDVDYVPLDEDLLKLVERPSSDFQPDAFRDAIAREAAERRGSRAPGATTLISNEELSGHPHGWREVDPFATARNLHAAWPDARIVICIRNQFDYLLSLYAFRVAVKGYESRGLREFLVEEGRRGLFAKVEYDQLIGQYIGLFGRDRVLVLPLELLKKRSAEFLRRLEAFIGLPIPPDVDLGRQVNESTRLAPVLRFWRPVNRVFHPVLKSVLLLTAGRGPEPAAARKLRFAYYGFKRLVTARLNRVFSGSRKLDIRAVPEYEELAERFARSNASLEALTGESLRGYGYPSLDPDTRDTLT